MKTAVEELEEYLKFTGVVIETTDTRCILQEEINKCKELEKSQILKAYVYGSAYGIDVSNGISPSKYFEEVYNKKR